MDQIGWRLSDLSKHGSHLRKIYKLVGLKLYLFVFVFAVTSCAANESLVFHSFQFDLRYDDQDAEMLDYRYGDSRSPARAAGWVIQEGKTVYVESVHGLMRRGDFLYAKWRNLRSKQVHEDTVDLRERLPADIKDHKITLMIKGSQLYVYLVTPDKRSAAEPPNGPRIFQDSKTITLYPDQPKR